MADAFNKTVFIWKKARLKAAIYSCANQYLIRTLPTTKQQRDTHIHAVIRLLYPVFQRLLVVFKLLFVRTLTHILEGRDEQTNIALTLCFAALGKQILTKGIVDFFCVCVCVCVCVCCETARYAQSPPVPDNRLKTNQSPLSRHLFTSRHIPTTQPAAWKQAAPLIMTHATHSPGSETRM